MNNYIYENTVYRRIAHALLEVQVLHNPEAKENTYWFEAVTKQIAEVLNLSRHEVETIGIAALMHDVGKVGIPGNLLSKLDRLTAEEKELLEIHTKLGHQVVDNIPGMTGIADLILYHHTPYNLPSNGVCPPKTGEDIPIGSRIIAVAEAFVSAIRRRSYEGGEIPETVLLEVKRKAGYHLDPTIVSQLILLIQRGKLELPQIQNTIQEVIDNEA